MKKVALSLVILGGLFNGFANDLKSFEIIDSFNSNLLNFRT